MVDPQLDDRHMNYFKIDFNPHDLPRGKFICGGNAWLMCRNENYDPFLFGLGGGATWDGGMDFVRPGVFSDLITLNKFEVQPWEIHLTWDDPSKLELDFIDSVAITTESDVYFKDRIALYKSFDFLRLPKNWKAK